MKDLMMGIESVLEWNADSDFLKVFYSEYVSYVFIEVYVIFPS